jgi:hypothetical protein
MCSQHWRGLSQQQCSRLSFSPAQVLAVESIADELVAKVVKGVEGLSVGKPEVGTAAAHAPALPHSDLPA